MHHNWDSLRFLDLHVYFPHQIREVFFHHFFQIDFQFLLFLFSFWHPYDVNLGSVEAMPEAAYTILIFFNSCFFLFFCMVVFCFFMFRIIDLFLGFLHSTVVSP